MQFAVRRVSHAMLQVLQWLIFRDCSRSVDTCRVRCVDGRFWHLVDVESCCWYTSVERTGRVSQTARVSLEVSWYAMDVVWQRGRDF